GGWRSAAPRACSATCSAPAAASSSSPPPCRSGTGWSTPRSITTPPTRPATSTTSPTRPAGCASAGPSPTASASAATTAPWSSGRCNNPAFSRDPQGSALPALPCGSRLNAHRGIDTMTSPLDTLPARAQGMSLSSQEVARYSRHLIMPEVGMEGQKRLKAASVLLIGAGGLGSPLALYLAAAGVGRIGLVDFDVVDFSNLQRQVLHGTADVGRPKLQS